MRAMQRFVIVTTLLGTGYVWGAEQEPPLRWLPPETFDQAREGLGLPVLKGVETHDSL